MSEALDAAGRQVPEDDEPAFERRKGQHDVADTGRWAWSGVSNEYTSGVPQVSYVSEWHTCHVAGSVTQWLGCRSLSRGLSLTCA